KLVHVFLEEAQSPDLDANAHVGNQVEQAVTTMETHFQVWELRNTADGSQELSTLSAEWVETKIVIDNKTEPKPQAADFDRLLLDLDAEEPVLDGIVLGVVEPARAGLANRIDITIGSGLRKPAKVDQFVEQAHGKRARAHSGIAALEIPQAVPQQRPFLWL